MYSVVSVAKQEELKGKHKTIGTCKCTSMHKQKLLVFIQKSITLTKLQLVSRVLLKYLCLTVVSKMYSTPSEINLNKNSNLCYFYYTVYSVYLCFLYKINVLTSN